MVCGRLPLAVALVVQIKFLVILREPVTRSYSHYQHDRRHKKGSAAPPDTFAAAIKEELQVSSCAWNRAISMIVRLLGGVWAL